MRDGDGAVRTLIAGLISPRVGSLLFAAWLALLAVRGAWTAIKVTSAVHHPERSAAGRLIDAQA